MDYRKLIEQHFCERSVKICPLVPKSPRISRWASVCLLFLENLCDLAQDQNLLSSMKETQLKTMKYIVFGAPSIPNYIIHLIYSDSASNRNEYQQHFLGVKAAGA
jgi:hypothetical protein